MTYRERRQQRAEKLREWAAKRDARSSAALERARQIGDMIPFGQPILVGHHSEGRHRRDLDRIDSAMREGVESGRMATSMASRADNIESQLDGAIYSDDANAIEALRARIAGLEAERERIKAFNASCRKGQPDESVLSDGERAQIARLRSHGSVFIGKRGEFPAYHLTNLSGNIKRNRDRLQALERDRARTEKAAAAGGVLVEHRGDYAVVTFAEKPERDVIDSLKAAGFGWGSGSWIGKTADLPGGII